MSGTKKNIIALPRSEDIEAEAAAWLTVLGREHVSEEDLSRFKAWLAQSQRHRRALEALSNLWGELEVLKELDDIAEGAVNLASPDPFLLNRRGLMAAAASVTLAVAGGGTFAFYRHEELHQTAEFATTVGRQRTFRLADGSSVQLNTDSRIGVEYTPAMRVVRLLRGEAYFSVAKNKERPFVVLAAGGAVRAVGTAFAVRLHPDDSFEVTVEEGRVALASIGAGHGETAARAAESAQYLKPAGELGARQSAVFGARIEHLASMQESELERKLAWRRGILVYSGVPLWEVVADVSRYTDVDIEISDPALRSKPVGGVFRVGELDALLDSLHFTFGLKVEHVNAKLIRLSAAS